MMSTSMKEFLRQLRRELREFDSSLYEDMEGMREAVTRSTEEILGGATGDAETREKAKREVYEATFVYIRGRRTDLSSILALFQNVARELDGEEPTEEREAP